MSDAVAAPIVRDHPRHFYLSMGLLLIALLFASFGDRYFWRALTDLPPLRMHIQIHAPLFTGWIVLFTIQAGLMASGRVALHRKVGLTACALALLITVVGMYSAIEAARNGHNPGAPNPLAFMIVPVGDILLFAGFVAAGIMLRRRRELHKRFMLLATIGGFAWPMIVRLPFAASQPLVMLAVLAALVLMSPLRDLLVHKRIHPIDLAGALIIVASVPARRAMSMTDAWQDLAGWLVGALP